MNANKPVAWRRQLDTGVYMYQEYYFGEAEPLYTHPVKEEGEQQNHQEADGCPTELAVLQRFWRKAQQK